MRELHIYPCLREAHLLEEDPESGVPTPVREANENLVEIFYLSEEASGPPPDELLAAAGRADPPESRVQEVVEDTTAPSAEIDEDVD